MASFRGAFFKMAWHFYSSRNDLVELANLSKHQKTDAIWPRRNCYFTSFFISPIDWFISDLANTGFASFVFLDVEHFRFFQTARSKKISSVSVSWSDVGTGFCLKVHDCVVGLVAHYFLYFVFAQDPTASIAKTTIFNFTFAYRNWTGGIVDRK